VKHNDLLKVLCPGKFKVDEKLLLPLGEGWDEGLSARRKPAIFLITAPPSPYPLP